MSADTSEQKSFYRFLKNPRVDEQTIQNSIYNQCCSKISGKSLLVIADTSSFVFKNQKHKIKDFEGLNRITHNQYHDYAGLIVHLNMVYDVDTHIPYGLSDIDFVVRKEKSRREKNEKQKRNTEYIEDKESNKWLSGFQSSKALLKAAKHKILVADREGDIIELLDRLPDENTDIIIRNCYNRNVINSENKQTKLYTQLEQSKTKNTHTIKIESKKRKKRIARVEIKAQTVVIPWASWKKVKTQVNPKGVKINVLKVKEKVHKGYKNEPKLIWYLMTTLPLETKEEQLHVINLYKRRWSVEEYFKLLKTDGYDLENTELTSGKKIRKLTLYSMKASIKVQQLKASRKGEGNLTINSVFTEKEVKYLIKLNPTLEGNTEKQKNPYPPTSLAYASWIIARLGGWKEFYDLTRPPGTKSIVWGLEKFDNMMIAVNLLDVS